MTDNLLFILAPNIEWNYNKDEILLKVLSTIN